jgi:hypothetical protein
MLLLGDVCFFDYVRGLEADLAILVHRLASLVKIVKK